LVVGNWPLVLDRQFVVVAGEKKEACAAGEKKACCKSKTAETKPSEEKK
jgi:hypothetical protein